MEAGDEKDLEFLQEQREKRGFKPGMCPTCWNTGKYKSRHPDGIERLKACPWGCLPTSTKAQ